MPDVNRFDSYRDLWSQLVRLGGRLNTLLAAGGRSQAPPGRRREVEAEYAAVLARIRDVQAGRTPR